MTTTDDAAAEVWSGRLSPAEVHSVLFGRAGFGRRGYEASEVDDFLDRVQIELSRLIAEKSELRDEVVELKDQLGGAASDEPRRDGASVQAVRVLAAAQQTADQYVADAEHYSRRISIEARQHYEEVIGEARARAAAVLEDAERLAQEAVEVASAAGTDQGLTKQQLDEQVAYLRTFGQVCRTQLRAYLEALLVDIEQEWGRADPGALEGRPVFPPHNGLVPAGHVDAPAELESRVGEPVAPNGTPVR
jgi:DivIVA domain-containing protein